MENQATTLTKDETGQYAIHRGGHPMFCPYVAPFVVQTALGGASLSRIPCTTSCPLAVVKKVGGWYEYQIHCGAERVSHRIEELPA